MGNEENAGGVPGVELGLKSSCPSPPLATENGNVVLDVEALLRSCSMKGLSPKVAERIKQADADQDGCLSVDELIEVIRTEMRAVSDRKLFRNILISLFVTVLVLVATLCGTVYAIVDLSKEVKNDNGVLVSSSTGDVMATGTAQQALTVGPDLLALLEFPEMLSKAHSVVVPAVDGDTATVYKVGKMTLSPSSGTVEVSTVDGTTLLMNQSGVYEASGDSESEYQPLFVSGGGRRKLMSDGDGVPENQAPTLVMDMGTMGATSLPACSNVEYLDLCTNDSCFCRTVRSFLDNCRDDPRFNEFQKTYSSNSRCAAYEESQPSACDSFVLYHTISFGLSVCYNHYPDSVNDCVCSKIYGKYWDQCSAEPDSSEVKRKLESIGKDYNCIG